ncbi:hypothetical protein CI109_102447 [Kwoniella shandongensis]|uniref:Uncharacterized protein n=1 Tax=Kwoniella shandongensis TaxID=1734106 RepID=A0A5M6BZN7_9TREE|nr:uncharacterized protein CI109_003234 [Kwoniella shandongensis]KAA5528336.1 hypothetical protein CI109_003234 [Kwoniella shandongensis]
MSSRIRHTLRPLLPSQAVVPSSARRPRLALPAVPFFRDPAHTIPTKWSLFRPLLRDSKYFPAVQRELRTLWKAKKGLTSVPRVRSFLEDQYKLLSKKDTSSAQDEVAQLNSRLQEKYDQLDVKARLVAANYEDKRPESTKQPRLTGAFHRPTLFNPPLPRLKPQPISISMMIHNRLRARERRMERRRAYASYLNDMKLETSFWREIGASGEGGQSDWTRGKDSRSPGSWDKILRDEIEVMDGRFQKENRRAEMVFDNHSMERVGKARKRRDDWWKDQQDQARNKSKG